MRAAIWRQVIFHEATSLCRTPVGLPAIAGQDLLCRPSVILQGLAAHYAAEALLNAPAILGSLDLLLNPTGLFHSIGQGFEDLVSLPLAALEAGSPSQVTQPIILRSDTKSMVYTAMLLQQHSLSLTPCFMPHILVVKMLVGHANKEFAFSSSLLVWAWALLHW